MHKEKLSQFDAKNPDWREEEAEGGGARGGMLPGGGGGSTHERTAGF